MQVYYHVRPLLTVLELQTRLRLEPANIYSSTWSTLHSLTSQKRFASKGFHEQQEYVLWKLAFEMQIRLVFWFELQTATPLFIRVKLSRKTLPAWQFFQFFEVNWSVLTPHLPDWHNGSCRRRHDTRRQQSIQARSQTGIKTLPYLLPVITTQEFVRSWLFVAALAYRHSVYEQDRFAGWQTTASLLRTSGAAPIVAFNKLA